MWLTLLVGYLCFGLGLSVGHGSFSLIDPDIGWAQKLVYYFIGVFLWPVALFLMFVDWD